MAVVGVRQDLTFEVFRDGVISDENGVVKINLMQQDMVAIRVVGRYGYATAVPATATEEDAEEDRFPFCVVREAAGEVNGNGTAESSRPPSPSPTAGVTSRAGRSASAETSPNAPETAARAGTPRRATSGPSTSTPPPRAALRRPRARGRR